MKSIANQRNEKLKSFNFLTTEKITITNIKLGARTNLEWYKLECEEYGHNVRNTVTGNNFLFLKVKNQIKKIKKYEYISLISIRDIENTIKYPIQRSILLNSTQKKKQNLNIQNNETLCKKMVKKILRVHLGKKIKLFFKKLRLKNDWTKRLSSN